MADGEFGKPYDRWTVAELKDELKSRHLAVTGRKTELISRLKEADLARVRTASEGASDAEAPLPEDEADGGHPQVSVKHLQAPNQEDKIAQRQERFGPAALTDDDKLQRRKERFNVASEEEKRAAREARFTAGQPPAVVSENPEAIEAKKLDRAKRFNTPCAELEEERKKARQERFTQGTEGMPKAALSRDEISALIKKKQK